MDFAPLERRRDHRKAAYTPITFRERETGEFIPAHLVDVSLGGAGLLTTDQNAPLLGQHISLQFETVTAEGGTETPIQRQTGVVVNTRNPQRGITRVGIRFIHRPEFGTHFNPPRTPLTDKQRPFLNTTSRYQTARHFNSTPATAAALN